jgi:hypothetical protein
MKAKLAICCLTLLAFALAGCRARTDRTEGTVLLSITNFDGLPVVVSAFADPPILVDEIILRNVPKDPAAETSELQAVELRSYEVRYRRRDTGTRVPPPTVQGLFGSVSPNGTFTVNNLPVLFSDQMGNPPISELRNLGVDSETGSDVVVIDVSIRFFGRTLSGDDVATEPATFTMEVRAQ